MKLFGLWGVHSQILKIEPGNEVVFRVSFPD